MAQDDLLLLATDGITDASNPNGSGYGEKELPHTLQAYQDEQQLLETIYHEALQFSSSTLLEDDATLIKFGGQDNHSHPFIEKESCSRS